MNTSIKYIYIINGTPRAGKDAFANLVEELSHVPVLNLSSVQTIKDLHTELVGYDDTIKSEKERKLISDTKNILDEYNDFSTFDIIRKIYEDRVNIIAFIHIREPHNINKLLTQLSLPCHSFTSIKTIFISNNQNENKTYNNTADQATLDHDKIKYNHYISNDGDINEYKDKVKTFIKKENLYTSTIKANNLIHQLLNQTKLQKDTLHKILSTINITFDYDETASNNKTHSIIKQLIQSNVNVYILTNRYDDLHKHLFTPHPSNNDLYRTINNLKGIKSVIFLNAVSISPANDILTNKEAKAEYLKNSNVLIHVDDDLEQLYHIHSKTNTIPLSVHKNNLQNKIITTIRKYVHNYILNQELIEAKSNIGKLLYKNNTYYQILDSKIIDSKVRYKTNMHRTSNIKTESKQIIELETHKDYVIAAQYLESAKEVTTKKLGQDLMETKIAISQLLKETSIEQDKYSMHEEDYGLAISNSNPNATTTSLVNLKYKSGNHIVLESVKDYNKLFSMPQISSELYHAKLQEIINIIMLM